MKITKVKSGISTENIGFRAKLINRSIWIKKFKKRHFTLYDDPDYAIPALIAFIDKQYYAVSDDIIDRHSDILMDMGFHAVTLYGGTLETGFVFWFPVYHVDDPENDPDYQKQLNRIAIAQKYWVKIRENEFGEEKWVKKQMTQLLIPEFTPDQMLSKTFPGNYFINHESHPLLKRALYLKAHASNDDIEEDV